MLDSVAFRAEQRASFAIRSPQAHMKVTGVTEGGVWEGERVPQSAPMRYLTRSYVEWLRLRRCVVHTQTSCCAFVPENARKPVSEPGFRVGVRCWGRLYLESPDKLAFELAEAL